MRLLKQSERNSAIICNLLCYSESGMTLSVVGKENGKMVKKNNNNKQTKKKNKKKKKKKNNEKYDKSLPETLKIANSVNC